jgi:hypothetical protein
MRQFEIVTTLVTSETPGKFEKINVLFLKNAKFTKSSRKQEYWFEFFAFGLSKYHRYCSVVRNCKLLKYIKGFEIKIWMQTSSVFFCIKNLYMTSCHMPCYFESFVICGNGLQLYKPPGYTQRELAYAKKIRY